MGGAYVSQALGKTGNAAVHPHLPLVSLVNFRSLPNPKAVGWCKKGVKARMDHHQLDLIWLK